MTTLTTEQAGVDDARRLFTDPADASLWRQQAAWWAPLSRRPHAGAVALGVVMLAVMVAVAATAGLPVRDADGILGSRFFLLVAVVGGLFALDLLPRAAVRAGPRPAAWPAALRTVLLERWSLRRLGVVTVGILSFYATYIAYRNLKSFLPLLVEQDLDTTLLLLEQRLFGGHDPAALLHALLGTGAAAHVLSAAYLAYLGFVPVTLGAALILSVNPVPGLWYVTALGINWALGALSYYLVPALGPVFVEPWLFAELPRTGVTALQEMLVEHRAAVLADPFATSDVQSIAAFASLHVSVVFTAALIAQALRLARMIRWSLWGFLGLTLLATVYFGWHYVVDDVAGLLIGALAVAGGALATGHWAVLRDRGARKEA